MDRRAHALQPRVDELVRRCRDAGMNVTVQRIAIYRALLAADDHPSPEQLHQRILRALPSVSLATVYKALDTLEELGVVREVSLLSETRRYDANLEQHHHLICTSCKEVSDFTDPAMDALTPPSRRRGFVVRAMSVQVLGLCARCARKRAPVRRRRAARGGGS